MYHAASHWMVVSGTLAEIMKTASDAAPFFEFGQVEDKVWVCPEGVANYLCHLIGVQPAQFLFTPLLTEWTTIRVSRLGLMMSASGHDVPRKRVAATRKAALKLMRIRRRAGGY